MWSLRCADSVLTQLTLSCRFWTIPNARALVFVASPRKFVLLRSSHFVPIVNNVPMIICCISYILYSHSGIIPIILRNSHYKQNNNDNDNDEDVDVDDDGDGDSNDSSLNWGWVKTLVPSEPQNSW